MIHIEEFHYTPQEYEMEKASNSYLMSVIAMIAGMPLPIINLIATLVFWSANRRGTHFVRWHCTQALLSQITLVLMNGVAFWWVMLVIFSNLGVSNTLFAYLVTVLIYNVTEFIATVISAAKTRKGKHIKWWFYGPLTDIICKP